MLLTLALLGPAEAAPTFQQTGNTLVMSNANVRLEYNLTGGTTDFYWQNSKKISTFYSGVTLDTGYIKGINYNSRSWAVTNGNQAVVTATGSGLPVMRQYFTLDQNDSFLVRVEVSSSNLKANWMGPVVVDTVGGVNIGITNDNRALIVPFDNDGFVRYNAAPMNSSGNGYEVGAFYDNTTRNGLVVGSVTHDKWKTGIFFVGANNKLNALNVYGGATMSADTTAHGYVTGNTVSSPTVFVGFGSDWRATMQNYAAANTNIKPRLAWTNGVPFGWNSYGVLQDTVTYADAVAVSDYFYANLMSRGFTNQGTAYINLDSFWDNLNSQQLQAFTAHCHARRQKAGIYWGPFVFWGTAAQGSNWVMNGSSYIFSEAYLRTPSGAVQTLDGAIALDPTHPGTKQMITYFINQFTNWGFDYIKLDFLSHGALEGVHRDTNVTTGIQAYNQGMQYLFNSINDRMFISESIAPLFPHQYAHSRRIACDAQTSLIADTEYTMNSVAYGWWLNGVYQFNDPDLMVFAEGANTNEAQSRLISGAVTGVFLNGDDLTTTTGQNGSQPFMTNAAMNDVARVGRTFTPVEGNTGSSAVNTFVRQDGATWCIAVFNYSSNAANRTVDLNRAGLPSGTYVLTDLWSGTTSSVSNLFNVSLNGKQAKLFQLAAPIVAQAQNANITWQVPRAISGAADVSTQGMYFGSWAPYDGGANTLPVNGVTFQGNTDLSSFSYTGFNAGYGSFPNPRTGDTNYNTLLQNGAYEYPGPACTINWSGMTPGHIYLVEIWVNGNDANRAETFTGGTNTSATINYQPGQYVIGTFVAVGSGAETVTLNGAPSNNYPQVNLLQVRDITGSASRPVIASSRTSGGNLIFSGSSGTANGTYSVLTSTNLTAPITNWITIATNFYDASGNFSATNAIQSNNSARFYIIKQP